MNDLGEPIPPAEHAVHPGEQVPAEQQILGEHGGPGTGDPAAELERPRIEEVANRIAMADTDRVR